MHIVAPDDDIVPATHAKHALIDVALTTFEYVPARQLVHEPAPDELHEPATQPEQDAEPDDENVPASH